MEGYLEVRVVVEEFNGAWLAVEEFYEESLDGFIAVWYSDHCASERDAISQALVHARDCGASLQLTEEQKQMYWDR